VQWTRSDEKIDLNEPSSGRTSSPIHVVQRTWESRNRDTQKQMLERDNYKNASPRSRSISPKSPANNREEKKSDTSRPSKSESFKIDLGESKENELQSQVNESRHHRLLES